MLVAAILGACQRGPERAPASPQKPTPLVLAERPSFSADSAYAFIEAQLRFGPRIPGTAGHRACGDWLVAQLRRFGARVYEQVGTYKGTPIRNIIASFAGADSTRPRVFLSAHWDSRPWADQDPTQRQAPVPGANDGASGVAVLLELARLFSQKPPPGLVDILLWDAEDLGQEGVEDSYCLGAQYWTMQPAPHAPRAYRWGINLDMVGAQGATFLYEGYSRTYAPLLLEKIWQVAAQLGYQSYFLPLDGDPIIDDPYYIITRSKIPVVNIIHRLPHKPAFFPEWHTSRDDITIIDKATLRAVGDVLTAFMYTFDAQLSPV